MADKKDDKKNEFGTPEKVVNVIKPMEDIERLRASDRAKIDDFANGKRPYTKEEEEKHQIQINVNWGEMKTIIRSAVGQLNAATLHTGSLFNCTCEAGQVDKRDEWSANFTKNLHRPLQRGRSGKKYNYLIKNRNLTVCVHGMGALLWQNPFRWMPRFVALEDLLIPTDTYCDLSNLRYFAVNLYLTPGELMDIMAGDKVKPGWNKKMVGQILDAMRELHSEGVPPTWRDQPEAMTNLFKENRGWYYSDAVPKIRARWFFYKKIADKLDESEKWYRVMILRQAYGEAKPNSDFLFDGNDDSFADDISQILNLQFGDSNYVAPLKIHAVRGIGVDLYAPVETNNRLRCEFVQSVFEHLKMYFKIQDPTDRDRLKQVVLSQYGFLPEGLQIVPRDDRHEIDPALVQDAMGQMQQIMQQSGSSFVKNVDDGSDKEMTAKEATIRHNQAQVMVSVMLDSIYLQDGFLYEEMVRRFLEDDSKDPDVIDFRKRCLRQGIPEEMLKAEHWRVTPNRVLGGGDKTIAQQEAAWIWSIKNDLDPAVQARAKRLVVGTMLNDFDKAQEFVPLAKVESTDGTVAAENVFGTLMQGQPCGLRKGIDQIGYVDTLLRMMDNTIKRIQQTDNVGSPEDIIGLLTVAQNVGQHVMIIAADPKEKGRVKQYGDQMGKMMNLVKAFAQRLAQKKQAQHEASQGDPAAAAKAKGVVLQAVTKAKIAEYSAQMKNRHKEIGFQLDQQRDNIALISDLKREELTHRSAMIHDGLQHVVDLIRQLQAPAPGGDDEKKSGLA